MLSLAALYPGYYGGGGMMGPGPWALVGPLWFLIWFLVIGALVFFFVGRGRRGRWMRGGPWGPGRPGGPWGPPPEGPDGEPVKPQEAPEVALDRARAILHER
ncbi:MAG: hypothetical protein J2P43_12420, partial [Candidatus Dormibacteraeota bacterium]|nr:hypothetical protein [Candidatus Dormibacteraeota bacterium]